MSRFTKWFLTVILFGLPNEYGTSFLQHLRFPRNSFSNSTTVVEVKRFTPPATVPIRTDITPLSGDIQVNDIWQLIEGSYYPANSSGANVKLALGYVSLKELAALSRTSVALNTLFQPILNIAKAWRQSEVVYRALSNQSDGVDYLMISLFTGHPVANTITSLAETQAVGLPDSSFNLALYMLCQPLISISDEERTAIKGKLGSFPFEREQNNLIFFLYNRIIRPSNELKTLNSQGMGNEMDTLIVLNDKRLSVIVLKYLYSRYDSTYELTKIAESLEKLEEKEAAISAWKKVVEHSNSLDAFLVSKAAVALERLGDREAAVSAWKKFVEQARDSLASEIKAAAEALERLEDREAAISAWKKLVKHSNSLNAFFVSKAAVAFERLGDREAAVSAWKKVVEVSDFGDGLKEAAKAFERLGDREAAIDAWKKVDPKAI